MTIVTVVLVAVGAILAVAVGLAGALARAQTEAQGAADASALAAASDARDRRALGQPYLGEGAAPCRVAGDVAARWGASVAACVVRTGGVATVEVRVAMAFGEVSATANAGPRSQSRRRAAAPKREPARRAAPAVRCRSTRPGIAPTG